MSVTDRDVAEIQVGLRAIYRQNVKINESLDGIRGVIAHLQVDKVSHKDLRDTIENVKDESGRDDILLLKPVVIQHTKQLDNLRRVLQGNGNPEESLIALCRDNARMIKRHDEGQTKNNNSIQVLISSQEARAAKAKTMTKIGEFFLEQGPYIIPVLGVLYAGFQGALGFFGGDIFQEVLLKVSLWLSAPTIVGLFLARQKRMYKDV